MSGEEPARRPHGDTPRPPRERERPRRRERDQERDEAPIVGLGSHVPSFLMRKTRIPTESSS